MISYLGSKIFIFFFKVGNSARLDTVFVCLGFEGKGLADQVSFSSFELTVEVSLSLRGDEIELDIFILLP